MFNLFMEYAEKATKNLKAGNVRVACFFLGKAAAFLDCAFQRNEIDRRVFIYQQERIDDIWMDALTK